MKIEQVEVVRLTGLPGNARVHPEEQIALLAEVIEGCGWLVPMLIDEDDMVIAGHGRLEAAKRLNLKTVPCVRADASWTDEQKRAYSILDNRLGEMSEWDWASVKHELDYLETFGVSAEALRMDPPALKVRAAGRSTLAKGSGPAGAPERPVYRVRCEHCGETFEAIR